MATRKKTPSKKPKTKRQKKVSTSPIAEFAARGKHEDFIGKYANLALIQHSAREFVLDFFLRVENETVLSSRIITNPQHAKALHKALSENIKRYEDSFGEIKDS